MIWSCEINYSGWEDDIHHHHFFIESDTKPTEEEVAEHYNQTRYSQDEFEHDTWIRKCPKEYKFDTGWEGVDTYGRHEYTVYITVEELRAEKLVPLTKAPEFKKPTKEMIEWGKKISSLIKGAMAEEPATKAERSFFTGEIDAGELLNNLTYGQQLDIQAPRESKSD